MPDPIRPIDRDDELTWVESVAAFVATQYGLPPATGRILGWLMICWPAEQSAREIAEAIGASRGSLSTNMRLLSASGLVRRGTRPGERASYYRVDDDAWDAVIRRQIRSLTAFRRIARRGLDLVGAESPRAARIKAADHAYAWLADTLVHDPGRSRPEGPQRTS